jgi:hypothetical protein
MMLTGIRITGIVTVLVAVAQNIVLHRWLMLPFNAFSMWLFLSGWPGRDESPWLMFSHHEAEHFRSGLTLHRHIGDYTTQWSAHLMIWRWRCWIRLTRRDFTPLWAEEFDGGRYWLDRHLSPSRMRWMWPAMWRVNGGAMRRQAREWWER